VYALPVLSYRRKVKWREFGGVYVVLVVASTTLTKYIFARRPSITVRIFSSAEYLRLVARRMSRTLFSALGLVNLRFVIIKSS
jgi:hypothetical protein